MKEKPLIVTFSHPIEDHVNQNVSPTPASSITAEGGGGIRRSLRWQNDALISECFSYKETNCSFTSAEKLEYIWTQMSLRIQIQSAPSASSLILTDKIHEKINNILQYSPKNVCADWNIWCFDNSDYLKPLHTSACVVLRLARLLGRGEWFLRHSGDKGF